MTRSWWVVFGALGGVCLFGAAAVLVRTFDGRKRHLESPRTLRDPGRGSGPRGAAGLPSSGDDHNRSDRLGGRPRRRAPCRDRRHSRSSSSGGPGAGSPDSRGRTSRSEPSSAGSSGLVLGGWLVLGPLGRTGSRRSERSRPSPSVDSGSDEASRDRATAVAQLTADWDRFHDARRGRRMASRDAGAGLRSREMVRRSALEGSHRPGPR